MATASKSKGVAEDPAAGVRGAVQGENPVTVPAVNKGEAFTSFDVEAFEVPSGRDENWRFTPMRRLRGLHDGKAAADGHPTVEVSGPDESDGVRVETVGRDDERLGRAGAPADRVAAQAFTSFEQATVVTVAEEAAPADPMKLTITGPGEGRTAYGHLQVAAERFSKAVAIIDQRGSGTYAENLEIIAGESANLTVVTIQDWNDDTVHVGAHHVRIGRDATVTHVVVTLGGDLVRITPTVKYDGPGGSVDMWGVYFADDGQHFEQRLLVDHTEPYCKSNVVYKGALQGDPSSKRPDARTAWVGDVLIRAAAEGTDTYEINNNLVLTDAARADSVPNLEIETGEIKNAGHASTTGRFDDEQLFYLRSRGIEEADARKLVVRGFFHEIIDRIPVEVVRERLSEAVESELAVSGS